MAAQQQGGNPATYMNDPFCTEYIQGIRGPRLRTGKPSREDQVDHLWSRIFKYHFESVPRFGAFDIQREPYVSEKSQRRPNISIANLRGNPLRLHKVLLFEAKRPLSVVNQSQPPTVQNWHGLEKQLTGYALTAREASGDNHQVIFAVAAVGLYVRMYSLPIDSNRLVRMANQGTYHVVTDAIRIHQWLDICADDIQRGRNV